MSNEILEFNKLFEGFSSGTYIPEPEEARIRDKYKDEINKNDVISPVLIYHLEKELKYLNRIWHITGDLKVNKGYGNEDAHVYLYFEYKDMSITVTPVFKDGKNRITRHRSVDEFAWRYNYSASISHPYFMGPSIFTYANPSHSKWIFYYSPSDDAPGTAFEKSESLLTPSKLYKELQRLEAEKGITKKGHIDHT